MLHPIAVPFYHVVAEADPPVVYGVGQRPLSAEEITHSCELLLATARRHACPYWLLDGRHHRGTPTAALHAWIREEYFPRVRDVLGRPVCVAFLVPPEVQKRLGDKGYVDPLDEHSPAARMAWFTDEALARAWLARQRAARA
jgi:hypothetical protein